jgi:hypothetical protein
VEDVDIRKPLHIAGRQVMSTGIMENNILQKSKIQLPCDPTIPLLGVQTKDIQAVFQRDICTPMFIAAVFTIAMEWETTTVHQLMN